MLGFLFSPPPHQRGEYSRDPNAMRAMTMAELDALQKKSCEYMQPCSPEQAARHLQRQANVSPKKETK